MQDLHWQSTHLWQETVLPSNGRDKRAPFHSIHSTPSPQGWIHLPTLLRICCSCVVTLSHPLGYKSCDYRFSRKYEKRLSLSNGSSGHIWQHSWLKAHQQHGTYSSGKKWLIWKKMPREHLKELHNSQLSFNPHIKCLSCNMRSCWQLPTSREKSTLQKQHQALSCVNTQPFQEIQDSNFTHLSSQHTLSRNWRDGHFTHPPHQHITSICSSSGKRNLSRQSVNACVCVTISHGYGDYVKYHPRPSLDRVR